MRDYKPTEEEIIQGYYIDDSDDGICLSCREHSPFVVLLEEDGQELGEEVSDCCDAPIERF